MLRLLVAALLVANLTFWAWYHTPLASALGVTGHDSGREPERWQHQLHPESIRVVPTAASRGAPAASTPLNAADPASGPVAVCLEAGPLTDGAASVAARELTQAGAQAGAWVDLKRQVPGQWMVFMGRFNERDSMLRKQDELQRLGVAASEVKTPVDLAPGLALGVFATQGDAQARMDRLLARGVHTAKLVQLPSPGAEHMIRVDRLEPAIAERLVPGNGHAPANAAVRWQPCAP